MIQRILAIILGRRKAKPETAVSENPDVILGLQEQLSSTSEIRVEESSPSKIEPASAAPVSPSNLPLQREILFIRAARGRPFGGYELLQSLLSCSLSWSEENRIFHRYEQHADKDIELFSVAAATKTGELNPVEMGNFVCPGLSLFVTLNNHIYPSVNFELMLDTARQLAEDLGGEILDCQQELLTPEKLQQIREKIKHFETKQQNLELFV